MKGTTWQCAYIGDHQPGFDANCYWCTHHGLPRQKVTAIVKSTVPVDSHEVKTQLEKLGITVAWVTVEDTQ